MINDGSPTGKDIEGIRYQEKALAWIHPRKDFGNTFHAMKQFLNDSQYAGSYLIYSYCILGPPALLFTAT